MAEVSTEVFELDFRDAKNQSFRTEFRDQLKRSGGLVLRNAVAKNKCDFYRHMLSESFIKMAKLAENRESVHLALDERTKGLLLKFYMENAAIGQLPPGGFEKLNPGFSMSDLVSNFDFFHLMADFFDGEFKQSEYAHPRRVYPDKKHLKLGWSRPLNAHTDAQYHGTDHFALNFWVPLTPCGTDAPGLFFCELPYEEAVALSGFDKSSRTFDENRLKDLETGGYQKYCSAKLNAPEMNVGDVLVFHNWTIHGTYVSPGMDKPRDSFEVRIRQQGSEFPV